MQIVLEKLSIDYLKNLPRKVDCYCGECKAKTIKCEDGEYQEEESVYVCGLCKREVPFCFGSGDKLFDYCNSCYCEIIETQEVELCQ